MVNVTNINNSNDMSRQNVLETARQNARGNQSVESRARTDGTAARQTGSTGVTTSSESQAILASLGQTNRTAEQSEVLASTRTLNTSVSTAKTDGDA